MLMEMAVDPVESYDEPEAGDILVIQRADGSILLAISTGNGSAVYATQDGGYVLETDLRSLSAGRIDRWSMRTAEQ